MSHDEKNKKIEKSISRHLPWEHEEASFDRWLAPSIH
jgi:hypothetical protein